MLPFKQSNLFGMVILFALTACGSSSNSEPEPEPEFEPKLYTIGDTGPAGGIVFHATDGGLHGLEAAPVDQAIAFAPGAEWGCIGIDLFGADGTAIGTGAQNTADILADCTETPIAADMAAGYTLNGFSDWFLPSIAELTLMRDNIENVGGFAGEYWSSSEVSDSRAEHLCINCGIPLFFVKTDLLGVRAARTF